MNKKLLTIIFGIVLLAGGVFAINEITNLEGIDLPSTIIGGDTIQANFSFEYINNLENKDNSPLIVKLKILSDDEINYPVWKGDFEIDGYVEKESWFGFWTKTIYFNCSENEEININHTIDNIFVENLENGSFYCYSEKGNLKLNEKDNVFLNIKPNIAIWPGKYFLNAQLFYLNDTTAPFILILNESYFDQYFRDGSYVDFNVEIYDGSGILHYDSKIKEETRNFSFSKELISENLYHFYTTLPNDITEGSWEVLVTAIDLEGNTGKKNSTIKIDLTSPKIELIQPTGTNVYSDNLPIELNVTDYMKSGVDNNSVKIRLREIKDGQICPETGGAIGNYSCITTNWIGLDYNESSKTFKKEINTTELNLTSGEYWLDAKANDILNNEAIWIQED